MTQTEQIRNHLLEGKSITPMDALREYGCFRLAARIDELRKEGLEIQTAKEKRNGKSYARYVLLNETPLAALGLTAHIHNILELDGVYSIEKLKKRSEIDLLLIPDMGKKRLRKIEDALQRWNNANQSEQEQPR